MRVVAAACCLFAAGCSTSLGITVPGPAHYEHRPSRPPVAQGPAPKIALTVPREALALVATAMTWNETRRTGEFRRIEPPLTYAIPYSFVIEHIELVAGVLMFPALMPVLIYQMIWWIWSRGLPDVEREALESPWGSAYRDAAGQALWPGYNVTAWWSWRAELLALDDARTGGWRRRTVIDRTPSHDAVTFEVRVGTGTPTVFRENPGADGRATWSFADSGLQPDADVTLTASGPAGTVTVALPATYVRAALEARRLHAAVFTDPTDTASRQRLAALYEAAGSYALARAEWERIARADPALAEQQAAQIARLWTLENQANRAAGRTKRALFGSAIRPLQAALYAGEISPQPLEAEPDALAGRLMSGVLRERVRNALAWIVSEQAPPEAAANAILSTAGDYHAPVAAWAALRACLVHPQPLAGEVLQVLLKADVPVEVHRLAAEATLLGDPEHAVAYLAAFAHRPGVHWVLNDATGAALAPIADVWIAWAETEGPKRQWDAATRRYLIRRNR